MKNKYHYYIIGRNLRQVISEVKSIDEGAEYIELYNRQDKNWGIYTRNYYALVKSKCKPTDFDMFLKPLSYSEVKIPRYQISTMATKNNGAVDEDELFDIPKPLPDLVIGNKYTGEKYGQEKMAQSKIDRAYAEKYKRVPFFTVWDSVDEQDVEIAGIPFCTLDKQEITLLYKQVQSGKLNKELQGE